MLPEDVYAGWLKARLDLLRGSVERVYALLAEPRSGDEDWRTDVAAQAILWRAIRDADAPDVPTRFTEVHRRGGAMLDTLTAAGDGLREAVDRRDGDGLDDAEKAARSVFVAAYRVMESSGNGG